MKIIKLLIIFNLIFINLLNASDKSLKIAISTDMIPYSFIDENKEPRGIFVDYWKLWSKKTNQKIEFVPLEWKETLSSIKNKQIDIHSGLFKNEEREKFVNYIKTIYPSQINIYINNDEKNKIQSLDDIEGKTIGVLNAAYFVNYIKKRFPSLKIKKYDNFKAQFKAIKNKEIDLFMDDSLIAWSNLIDDFSFNKVSILADFELNKWFYAGIKQDDIALEKQVLQGMNKISIEDLIQIEKKWVIEDNFRYFEKRRTLDSLTYEERLWLLQNSSTSLAIVPDWERYSFLDAYGEMRGFHIDLVNEINKSLNTNIKFKVFPTWSDAYSGTIDGSASGILGLSWSKEREKFFNYSPSYHFSPYYIITKKDNASIKSLADFSGKRIAAYEKSITHKIINEKASNVTFVSKNTIDEIISAIKSGEAQSAIIENAKAIDLESHGLIIIDSVFSKYGEISIGTTKNKKLFANIMHKGINSLSSSVLNKLKDKWFNQKVIFSNAEASYIKRSKVLKVGIEEWTGVIGTEDSKTLYGVAGALAQKAFDISGLKIEYIKGDWSDLLSSFYKGEIDILPATMFTKERKEKGDYSDKYLSIKNYIYVKSNDNAIHSLKDLENKKLAIVKDYGTINLVKEKFPKIKIIETTSLSDSIDRVLNGEVDALFEIQLSVENKMKESLITNLKAVNQNSISSQGLYMYLKKYDILLKNILNKSLESIPNEEKNKIISKWVNSFNIKKDLNIAFGLGRDPYILNKENIKGIEYDLMKKILSASSLNINSTKNFPTKKLDTIIYNDEDIDVSVTVKEKENDSVYYSLPFIKFNNVAVSRKVDNLKINKIKDLENKRLIAFVNAYKYLGEDYNQLFNIANRPASYKEIFLQEQQVQELLDEKTDVIILDKNIFKWFFNKLSNESISDYKFHYLFPQNNSYKVAFKDKNLRDIFNESLKKIRANGIFDDIINDYTKDYINSKVKINSLLSSLLGKFIFTEDMDSVKDVLKIFSSLAFIDKIEVFDIHNKLLAKSSSFNLHSFNTQDSYYHIDNIPQKVGSINVYYNNNLLAVHKDSNDLIPSLENFKKLREYIYIEYVYKNFGYINKKIEFTKKEKDFIKEKKVITFSSSNWEPINMFDGDKLTGLTADYLELIEKESGLEFKYVKSKDWKDLLSKYRKKEINMIPSLGDVVYTFKDSLIADSMASFKYAIVTNKSASYVDGLKDLEKKTLAIPKGYSSYFLMKKIFPNINIIETSSVEEALSLVSKNKADAFIGHSAVAVYNLQNEFHELKIAGLSDERFHHHTLIQDEFPELKSILDKVISNITLNQRQEIKSKWIRTEVSTAVDYTIIYRIVAIFTIILLIILIFTKKLSRAKKEVELVNTKMHETLTTLMVTKEELIHKSKDLEDQKNAFETLFNDSTDGLLLIKDGEFIACNDSVLNLLKYSNKKDFLNTKPSELSPELQPCGESSFEKSEKVMNECLNKGTSKFEWLHKKTTGELIWVEVVLTKIVLNHEDVIHVVWRDIEDKKALEEQNLKRTQELEDTNNELEVSISNLQQTQEQLIEAEKMASLGGLVAGVAHEINTPVGIGLTASSHFEQITKELTKAYNDDDMTEEQFSKYLKTANDLSHLINSNLNKAANLVKSFKQVAVDQTSEERREFELKEYIDEILSSIHSVTRKTRLDIVVSCPSNIRIFSYPGAFSQILTNLIMNSIIHAYEENQVGVINISVEVKNNKVILLYTNDGKHIPEENLAKIFNPFFTTNRANGGSGLGLNILYNIVTTKLDGTIKCKNIEKGVEFKIKFAI